MFPARIRTKVGWGLRGLREGLYTVEMFTVLYGALRFWWRGSVGHRLRPWRSPYLRWRMETFTGQRAETLRLRDFVRLGWRERGQVGRFLSWTVVLRGLTRAKKK